MNYYTEEFIRKEVKLCLRSVLEGVEKRASLAAPSTKNGGRKHKKADSGATKKSKSSKPSVPSNSSKNTEKDMSQLSKRQIAARSRWKKHREKEEARKLEEEAELAPIKDKIEALMEQEELYKKQLAASAELTKTIESTKQSIIDSTLRCTQLQSEITKSQLQASNCEKLLASLPEPSKTPTSSSFDNASLGNHCTAPPAIPTINPTPLHELVGPIHLVASNLPPTFPPELSFRALSCYSLLRTLSVHLRISPFTPTSFLRALTLPIPSQLLGEIHVAVLRYLFADVNVGEYHTRGSFRYLDKKDTRGGYNMNYMDVRTWTLFFEDYVELSLGKYLSDGDYGNHTPRNVTSNNRKSHNEKKSIVSKIDEDHEASKEIEAVLHLDEQLDKQVDEQEESDNDELEYNISDAEDHWGTPSCGKKNQGKQKKRKITLLNSRPQRGAKSQAVERLNKHAGQSDDHTVGGSSDDDTTITTEDNISLSSKKEVTPLVTSKVSGRAKKSISDVGSIAVNNKNKTKESVIKVKKGRGRPRKKAKTMIPKPNSSNTSCDSSDCPNPSSQTNNKSETVASKTLLSISASNADEIGKKSPLLSPAATNAKKEKDAKKHMVKALVIEKETVEPLSHSTENAAAFQKFMSTVCGNPSAHHKNSKMKAKLMIIEKLSHVQAARSLRQGKGYNDLPLRSKVSILEFLLDELLATLPIASELQLRHTVTSAYPGKFGPLPTVTQLENLTNVDECVVCGIEGDLICCDGCTASYHRKCINISTEGTLPEGTWLCTECKIVDPAKLGPLHGGSKPALEWFSMKDITPLMFPQDGLAQNNSSQGDNNLPSSNSIPSSVTQPSDGSGKSDKNPLQSSSAEQNNAVIESKSNQNENPYFSRASPYPSFILPRISPDDEREFLVVHGYVFQRNKHVKHSLEPSPPPTPLSTSELFDLLNALGPLACTKWPWCQIPFNPFLIWPELCDSQDAPTLKFFKEKRHMYIEYFLLPDSHNPTAYVNLYRKAPRPSCVLSKYGHLNNAVFHEEVLRLKVLHGLTRDMSSDKKYLQAYLSYPYNSDILKGSKDFIISLHRTLSKAYLLHELWDLNKKLIENLWVKKVLKCESISVLAKLCVELVDFAHSRAFHDDWNKCLAKDKVKFSDGGPRIYFALTEDWKPEKECRRRDWERCNFLGSMSLLRKEGTRLGGCVKRKKGRKRRAVKFEGIQDLAARENNKHLSDMLSVEVEQNICGSDLSMNERETRKLERMDRDKTNDILRQFDAGKKNMNKTDSGVTTNKTVKSPPTETQNLSMTPGALRARAWRKKERELKSRADRARSLAQRARLLRQKQSSDLEQPEKQGGEESSRADSKQSKVLNNGTTTTGHRKRRKKSGTLNRRRSERHLCRTPTVQETIESLTTVAPSSGISTSVNTLDESELPLDQEIRKQRNIKISSLEILLNQSYEKQMHWPLCGNRFFPPAGSLPLPVVRRLARNAGMKPAPFMLYSDKYEVGQPSVAHCWRKRTLECKTLAELSHQLCILDSFINRSTIHSCDSLGRRSANTKANVQKVIRCTHIDPATGLTEHFVLNRGKNRGTWLSEEAVDQSALILERSNRIDAWRNSFAEKLLEKKKKEQEIREREDKIKEDKRRTLELLETNRKNVSMMQQNITVLQNEINVKNECIIQTESAFLDIINNITKEKERLEQLKVEVDKAKAEIAARKAAEKKRLEEEEKRQKAIEEERIRKAKEAQIRKAQEAEKLRKAKAKEAEKMRKAQEEIERRRRAEEQQRIQRAQEEQDLLRRAQEEHMRLIKEEEERLRKMQQEENLRKAEEERMHQARISEMESNVSEAEMERAFHAYIDAESSGKNKGRGRNTQSNSTVSDENRFEEEFLSAVTSHREATKKLLKQSADLGLTTVPVEQMTQTRLEHMRIMKEANNKLRLISSSKCLEEGELTKALADAENEGVDMYIEESDREKNASTTPSSNKTSYDNPGSYRVDHGDEGSSMRNENITNRQEFSSSPGRSGSVANTDHQSLGRQFWNQLNSVQQQGDTSFSGNSHPQSILHEKNISHQQQLLQLMNEQGLNPGLTQLDESYGMNDALSRLSHELDRQPQTLQGVESSRTFLNSSNLINRDQYAAHRHDAQLLMGNNRYGSQALGGSESTPSQRHHSSSSHSGNAFSQHMQAQQRPGQFFVSDQSNNRGIMNNLDQLQYNASLRFPSSLDGAAFTGHSQHGQPTSFSLGSSQNEHQLQFPINMTTNEAYGGLGMPNRASGQRSNPDSMEYNLW